MCGMRTKERERQKEEGDRGRGIMRLHEMRVKQGRKKRKERGKKEQKKRRRPAGGRADGVGVFLSFISICTFLVFHLRQMCFAY